MKILWQGFNMYGWFPGMQIWWQGLNMSGWLPGMHTWWQGLDISGCLPAMWSSMHIWKYSDEVTVMFIQWQH